MNADLKEKITENIQSGLYANSISLLQSEMSRNPEDVEVKMLLGLCCQMSGDEGGCLRIYEEVRPQMELREAAGERSDAVSFWQKYRKLVAALFAVGLVPFCFSGAGITNDCGAVSAHGVSIPALSATNCHSVALSISELKALYSRVMKMPLREQFEYFLAREDIRSALNDAPTVVIPLQGLGLGWGASEQDVIVLVRDGTETNGVAESPQDGDGRGSRLRVRDRLRARLKNKTREVVCFSPFECILKRGDDDARGSDRFWGSHSHRRFEPVIDDCETPLGLTKALTCIDRNAPDMLVGTINLVDGKAFRVYGVAFTDIHGSSMRTKYGCPRDYGDRFPKIVRSPEGRVLYQVDEEEIRREYEELEKSWGKSGDNDF